MPMEIHQANPLTIPLDSEPSQRDVTRQAERLEREGQIEPIALVSKDGPADLDEWTYANAQIVAAIQLNWPTILVTY